MMRVISVPIRLRVATALIFLSLPLAALEHMLVTRSPWWRLPYEGIRGWAVLAFLVFFPLSIAILRGKRWALALTRVAALIWCVSSFWMTIRMRSSSLAFFTFALIGYWTFLIQWLSHELNRSFFDPLTQWFQGLPPAIPTLTCMVDLVDGSDDYLVSRLDGDGAFVFKEGGGGIFKALSASNRIKSAGLTFRFRERQVRCLGAPIRLGAFGAGFQFRGMSADSRKELGDFVETLRGEGYV